MKKSFRGVLVLTLALLLILTSCAKKEEPAAEAAAPAPGVEKVTDTVEAAKASAPDLSGLEFEEAIPTEFRTDMDRFFYSYGYALMEAVKEQNLIPNGAYFARGIIDCVDMKAEPLVSLDNIMTVLNDFLSTFEGGGEAGDQLDLEAVRALPVPGTAEEEFAYAYGFYNAFGILQQMIDIDAVWFPQGALDSLYGNEPLLTEEEIMTCINDYFAEKERQYREWLEATAAKNLDLAEKMLKAKAETEGNIVLSDELVIEPVSLAEGETEMAGPADSVTVNYTLRDVHGNVMDKGDAITFPISGVIPGFGTACMNMHIGDSIIAYVHPSIGYGEYGTGNIAPNSLLVFEIELLDVVKGE